MGYPYNDDDSDDLYTRNRDALDYDDELDDASDIDYGDLDDLSEEDAEDDD